MDLVSNMLVKTGILGLSDKQILLLKKTYRKTTERYYENNTVDSNALSIIYLNNLVKETISTKKDSDSLAILSVLQILKVKSKSNSKLLDSVESTVAHLKQPKEIPLKFQTILKCFQDPQLFSIGCTLAVIFYSKLLKAGDLNWKSLIIEMGKHPSINTEMSLQLSSHLCKDNEGNAKLIVKSGFVKYIFSFYLSQKLEDKYLLYKALKFLRLVANADRSIVKDRQNSLAEVIYQYDQYIPVIEQICQKCQDQEYFQNIYTKKNYSSGSGQINPTYVWSYQSNFAKKIPSKNVEILINLLSSTNNKDLTPELQTKGYAILNNVTKAQGKVFEALLTKPPKSSKALLNYLKFVSSSIENDVKYYDKINLQLLEKLASDDEDPKAMKLFRFIEGLKYKEQKPTQGKTKLLDGFSIEKNADILMQKASKVPKNNDQLRPLTQILKHTETTNEFQDDILNSVKDRAINSISTAVIHRHNNSKLDLSTTFKDYKPTNIPTAAKLLKVLEVALMMGDYTAEQFDQKGIFAIIQWIENNYSGELIDWGSIGQIIMIFVGDQEWKNHLNEIPGKCYWLLGCAEISSEELKQIIKVFNDLLVKKLDKSNPKYALPLGFIGKTLQRNQKLELLSSCPSYFKDVSTCINSDINWKTNLYMQALFLSKWFEETNKNNNKQFQSLIQPVHTQIMKNFRSTEHEYRYLQSCLPYKIPSEKLIDNIDYLLSEFGSLASYIYKNTNPKVNMNYDKISNITNIPDSQSDTIVQLLKFLASNPQVIQNDEANKLLKKVTSDKSKYWTLYPNFVAIVNSLLQIMSKSENNNLIKLISELLADLIVHVETNEEISPQESDEILENINEKLKLIIERGVQIDVERIRRASNKIKNEEIKVQILNTLSTYMPKQPEPKKTDNQVAVNTVQPKQSKSTKATTTDDKYTENLGDGSDRNYMTALNPTKENQQTKNNEEDKEHLWIDGEANTLDEEIENLEKKDSKGENSKELSILLALRKLKKINEKKEPVSEFPSVVEVVQNNDLNPNHKDILGHLLVQFYNLEKHPTVLNLLLRKQKTSLSKQACYQIVSLYTEAFILSERWKFMGKQWLELAIQRISKGFMGAGCQVAEYNLIDVDDLHYFYIKKYHLQLVKNIYKVQNEEDAVFYLLLVGTAARMGDIKICFIKEQIHLSILNYIEKYPHSYKIIANTFYALSSMVYVQSEICLDIVKKEGQIMKLLNGLRENPDSRAVVESGGCFIANMAYSCDQVKEILRKYGVIEILVHVFTKNLQDPQISTFKQLLRSLGNLSLSQKCAQQIISSGYCLKQTLMIEKFNMFINLDENKLKLLKIAIDVFSNLCSHKYKLQVMHDQQVTVTMIMLLQTTEINPPIIMGCIDTVDGLCQNQDIEKYAVMKKKLPYILIDVLKIQQDEKIVVKATRLLTNLTINVSNIKEILQANLLSVLANIVMPSFFSKYNVRTQQAYLSNNPTSTTPPNKKMEMYINKILVRIEASNPKLQLILKSGYLDCLVRTIETADNLQDIYIDILSTYAKSLPNFLNKRAFMCLIRVMIYRVKNKDIIEKCFKLLKVLLLHSYDRDEQDVVLEDSPKMYEKMLTEYRGDTLFLLGLHCNMSKSLRRILIKTQKQHKVISTVYELSELEQYQELANTVLFTLFNKSDKNSNVQVEKQQKSQEEALKILTEGFLCELYRIDGSSKKAKIMMNSDYNIVAFKFPDGEIKRKYVIDIKKLRDWQFDYQKGSRQWKLSIFNKDRGMFSSEVPAQLCGTLVGGLKWGQVSYINVSFQTQSDKQKFRQALATMIFALT